MRGKGEGREEGNVDLIEICYFFQSKECNINIIMLKKEGKHEKQTYVSGLT